jgi:hypothetical protein
MNLPSILLSGLAATVVLTTATILGQSLGLTRIDMPFIVGTIFSSDRDRARAIGLLVHALNGWLFAVVYALFFQQLGMARWWMGALLGGLQGLFVVTVLLPLLPGVHPRMVSDFRGPEPARLLEPPGFLARNYGRNTALVVLAAHALYGAVIGALYVPR